MSLEIDNNTFKNVLFNKNAQNNIFACDSFEEIHFDTFIIKSKGIDFIKEKVDTNNGNPIVLFDVRHKGHLYQDIPFELQNQKNTIINENLMVNGLFQEHTNKPDIIEVVPIVEDVFEPIFEPVVHTDYNKIKEDAVTERSLLYKEQQKHKEFISNTVHQFLTNASNNLTCLLEQHKSNLLASLLEKQESIEQERFGKIIAELELIQQDAFKTIANYSAQQAKQANSVLAESSSQLTNQLKLTLTEYLSECTSKLNGDVENGVTYFHSTIHDTIQKLNESSNNTFELAVKQVEERISKCNEVINDRINVAKSELTLSLNEHVNNAVNKELINLQEVFNNKVLSIDELQENVKERVNVLVLSAFNSQADPLIEQKISSIREELIELVHNESTQTKLFASVKQEAVDSVSNLFLEAKSNNKLDVIFKENREKLIEDIKLISDQYSKNLERKFKIYSDYIGGGGTNALQLANGGTINGTLNVTQQILSGGIDISSLFGSGGGGSDDVAVSTLVRASSANWNGVYSTVNANSATWGAGGGDDVAVSTLVRASSAKWDYTYTTLNASSANWNSNYTTVNSNSAYWTNGIVTFNSLSSSWNNAYTTLNVTSASWVNSTTILTSNSSNWNSVYNTTASTSARWSSAYTTVNVNSASWNNVDVNATTFVRSNSANWNASFTATSTNSAYWTNGIVTLNTLSSSWSSVYSTVNANSATWGAGGGDDVDVSTYVRNTSASIASNYNTVNALSSRWESVYTNTNANSSNWNSVYSTVRNTSASWGGSSDTTGVATTVNANSANWGNSYTWVNANSSNLAISNLDTRYVNVTGDTITGSLSVTQTVNVGDVQFTGLTSIAVTSVSATNVFLQIAIGSTTKYIRLYDIV